MDILEKFNDHPKIDEKDKKILYHLLTDARQASSVLAKKVRLSREVVDYRIKRLEKMGIIKRYVTLVNTGALGFWDYYVCIELRDVDKKREKEIIDYLKNHPFCKWVAICTGRFDLTFTITARDRVHYDDIITEISTFIGDNLRHYEALVKVKQYKISSLVLSEEEPFEFKPLKKLEKKMNLDDTDMQILSLLSNNARMNIVDISRKVKLTPEAVSQRIKKMVNGNIIRGFKAMVDVTRLGYWWHVLYMKLRMITKEQEATLATYFKMNRHIFYAEKLIGRWNIKIELLAKDQFEFKEILDELKNYASKMIRSYDLCMIFEDVHQQSFTPGMMKKY
jgi:Lrp/AsnC family leucine-responsive transcriptional regulator